VIAVTGTALWAPGYPTLEAWRSGEADPEATEPACAMVTPRAKRGTSRVMRMLGEVVEHVAADARIDLSQVPTIYASAWGEIDTMVKLLEQIFDQDPALSPLRFKHSVHNAASGMVSIACDNRGFSTAIAAGRRTFEMGVLEAVGVLEGGADEVVLAVSDDALPPPLDRYGSYEGLAVALVLARDAASDRARALLSPPRVAKVQAPPELPAAYAENPAAWALPLLDALQAGKATTVPLSGAERPFVVDVSFGAAR